MERLTDDQVCIEYLKEMFGCELPTSHPAYKIALNLIKTIRKARPEINSWIEIADPLTFKHDHDDTEDLE